MTKREVKNKLKEAYEAVSNLDDDKFILENIQKDLMEAAGENRGEFLWPLRTALTMQKNSVSPFECVWVLGKEEAKKRIRLAIEAIE